MERFVDLLAAPRLHILGGLCMGAGAGGGGGTWVRGSQLACFQNSRHCSSPFSNTRTPWPGNLLMP